MGRIASCNVTSLAANWAALVEEDWDVLALQETCLHKDGTKGRTQGCKGGKLSDILKNCKDRGWTFHRGREAANGYCLVGFLVRRGAFKVDGPLPVGHPTRSLVATWYAGGAAPVRIFNLYGDPYGNARERDETSAMVAEALAAAESLGAVPALICGDLNQTLGDLDVVAPLAFSRWADVGAPRPTCKTAQSKEYHRIDVMLANPALQARIRGHHLWWVTTVSTHAMQRLEILLGDPPMVHKWKKAPALPAPPKEGPVDRAQKPGGGLSGGVGRPVPRMAGCPRGLECHVAGPFADCHGLPPQPSRPCGRPGAQVRTGGLHEGVPPAQGP